MSWTKYNLLKRQVYSGGTWVDATPLETKTSDPSGTYSGESDCYGVEPMYRWTNKPISQDYICDECHERYIATFNDGTSYTGYCNLYSDELYHNDVTKLGGKHIEDVVHMTIGGCVKRLKGTFIWFTNLSGVTLPNTLIEIGTVYGSNNSFNPTFSQLPALKEFYMPQSVEILGNNTFLGSSGLTKVTMSNQLQEVPDGCFWHCHSLNDVTLPIDVRSINTVAFSYCSGLTSMAFPDSLNEIGQQAFEKTKNLRSATFSSNSRLISIGNSAFEESGLLSFTVPSGVTSIGNYAFYRCSDLETLEFSPNSRLTTIGSWAFEYCQKLSNDLVLPEGLTTIGPVAFENCHKLPSVTIPSTITTIDIGAFYNCSAMTAITINAVTPPTLVDSSAFNSTNLCPIYVPAQSVNAYKNAGGQWQWVADRIKAIGTQPITGRKLYAKYTNNSTETITCNGSVKLSINEINNMSRAKSGMTNIEVGNCVEEIGDYAFQECRNLTYASIPSSVTKIGNYAFAWCNKLNAINIPSGVTSIGSYAYYNCSGVTSVNIPDSVSTIGDLAFGAMPINSIHIGSGITSIGTNAFVYTYYSGITSITIDATTPPTLSGSVFDPYIESGETKTKIYVPRQSVSAYKSAPVWRDYWANCIYGK
jgi:hypothetical protein